MVEHIFQVQPSLTFIPSVLFAIVTRTVDAFDTILEFRDWKSYNLAMCDVTLETVTCPDGKSKDYQSTSFKLPLMVFTGVMYLLCIIFFIVVVEGEGVVTLDS